MILILHNNDKEHKKFFVLLSDKIKEFIKCIKYNQNIWLWRWQQKNSLSILFPLSTSTMYTTMI